jgi:hypothetical protein
LQNMLFVFFQSVRWRASLGQSQAGSGKFRNLTTQTLVTTNRMRYFASWNIGDRVQTSYKCIK